MRLKTGEGIEQEFDFRSQLPPERALRKRTDSFFYCPIHRHKKPTRCLSSPPTQHAQINHQDSAICKQKRHQLVQAVPSVPILNELFSGKLTKHQIPAITTSTRRLAARPSSVSLLAIGLDEPYQCRTILDGSIPLSSTRYSATISVRC